MTSNCLRHSCFLKSPFLPVTLIHKAFLLVFLKSIPRNGENRQKCFKLLHINGFSKNTPFLIPTFLIRNSEFKKAENYRNSLKDNMFFKNAPFLLPKTDYGKKPLYFKRSCFLVIYYIYNGVSKTPYIFRKLDSDAQLNRRTA